MLNVEVGYYFLQVRIQCFSKSSFLCNSVMETDCSVYVGYYVGDVLRCKDAIYIWITSAVLANVFRCSNGSPQPGHDAIQLEVPLMVYQRPILPPKAQRSAAHVLIIDVIEEGAVFQRIHESSALSI
ncbi:MAG: hypothetical protein D6740_11660 [Alphaproteobacteria bacterium]|nr:MAG: hypothetical protein D6740_11660 [Alphaproteobacteria bacterium]